MLIFMVLINTLILWHGTVVGERIRILRLELIFCLSHVHSFYRTQDTNVNWLIIANHTHQSEALTRILKNNTHAHTVDTRCSFPPSPRHWEPGRYWPVQITTADTTKKLIISLILIINPIISVSLSRNYCSFHNLQLGVSWVSSEYTYHSGLMSVHVRM